MTDLRGTLVDGRYRVLEPLGAGGMADVWLAEQASLSRRVALKVMRPGRDEDLERFKREARAISRVKHDNVVVVFDTGTCASTGVSFIAMELLEGNTLRARLRDGAIPADETVPIILQLAQALSAAHGAGIVHRDVKPENVMLLDRPRGRVKLLDFGIARTVLSGDTLTASHLFIGTPAYAAPEVLFGRASHDPKSDVYSLGAMWFEMVSGRKPFEGRNAFEVAVHNAQVPAPRLAQPGVLAGRVAFRPRACAELECGQRRQARG